MLVGGVVGILISLAEEFLPKRYIKWIPSAMGLGIAGVIPAYSSISMFIGAFAAWSWLKIHNKSAEDYTIPGSSGLIAGESLTGMAINFWKAAPAIGAAGLATLLRRLDASIHFFAAFSSNYYPTRLFILEKSD